jgi:hypothetical protein
MALTPPSSRSGIPSQWTVGASGELTIAVDDPGVIPLTIDLPTGASAAGQTAVLINQETAGPVMELDCYGALSLFSDTVDVTNGGGALQLTDRDTVRRFLLRADDGAAAAEASAIMLENPKAADTYDVLLETSRFGNTATGARLRLNKTYAASPSDPPAGETDIIVIEAGATQVLRVRYNDGGTMRVGDIPLV